jgi:hypothetical protein
MSLVALTEALLKAGVLEPSDWNGDLMESVHQGITRWVNVELGAGEVSCLDLVVGFSNDIGETWSGMAEEFWRSGREEAGEPENEEPVGCFYIASREMTAVNLETRVLELESVSQGAGYAVLGAVSEALGDTIGAATFWWAQEQVAHYAYFPEEVEQEDNVLAVFNRTIPEKAYMAQIDTPSIQKALRKRNLSETHRTVFKEALALSEIIKSNITLNDMVDFEETESVMPILFVWDTTKDPMVQIVDEFHDLMMQSGAASDVLWFAGWQMHRPDWIAFSIERLKRILDVIVRADRLLRFLDFRPNIPLIEVLKAERVKVQL